MSSPPTERHRWWSMRDVGVGCFVMLVLLTALFASFVFFAIRANQVYR